MEDKKEYWGNEIYKLCPILYIMHDRPMTETCMCWGFECGDGWKDNIKNMSLELEELNKQYYPKYKIRIQMDQVKEKYGYLTCYHSIVCDKDISHNDLDKESKDIFDMLDQKTFDIVSKYEEKCFNTCEDCGTEIGTELSPRIETKGWYNYICEKCNKKREEEYERLRNGTTSSNINE